MRLETVKNRAGIKMKHKDSNITLGKVFALQDAVSASHLKNNKQATLFAEKSIEFCLNRNKYCVNSPTCNKDSLKTFEVLFQEVLSSLIVAYRVGLWGATTDGYAILRNVMEGLGFINDIVEKGDFVDVFKLMDKDKLKGEYIEKRFKHDKVLNKTIGIISDLASHFTPKRMAQRVFKLDNKQFARIATAYYENENELSKRLGHFLNTTMYAVKILKEFYDKYHKDCVKQQFNDDYQELEKLYDGLVSCSYFKYWLSLEPFYLFSPYSY